MAGPVLRLAGSQKSVHGRSVLNYRQKRAGGGGCLSDPIKAATNRVPEFCSVRSVLIGDSGIRAQIVLDNIDLSNLYTQEGEQ